MYARTYRGLIYILRDSLAALVEDGFEQRVEAESWVRRPCRFSRRKPGVIPTRQWRQWEEGHERNARFRPRIEKTYFWTGLGHLR